MNRLTTALLVWTILTLSAVSLPAQNPEAQYVRIYNLIQQADALKAAGNTEEALPKYIEANSALSQIRRVYPEWQPTVVGFRLRYLADKIESISGSPVPPTPVATPSSTIPPTTTTTQASVPAPTPAPVTAQPSAEMQRQMTELQDAVKRLQAEKLLLEAKLKEAFATQPATVDPAEFNRAQERVASLLKENELLKAGLEQEKQLNASSTAKKELEETRRLLADTNTRLVEQRAANDKLQTENQALQSRLGANAATANVAEALRAENELLKKQVANAEEKAAAAAAQVASIHSDTQVLRLEKLALEMRLKNALTPPVAKSGNAPRETDLRRIRELEQQRDDYQKKLAAANRELRSGKSQEFNTKIVELNREVEKLKSRLEVFEARAIPYSAEELALFQKPAPKIASTAPAQPQAANRPAGAANTSLNVAVEATSALNLMAEAEKHFAAREYDQAEKNYQELLRVDDKNPITHANLAAIQMEGGRLDAAERELNRALELAPENPHAVSLLGNLKFRQEKYDEAIELLNRAAKLNPKDADVQNLLGVTLSQKGLRGPAEQAFRRAILLNSGHAGAHHNLAVFYASENPPNIPLARFHYQKAMALGHPKNAALEQLFETKEQQVAPK